MELNVTEIHIYVNFKHMVNVYAANLKQKS